MDRLKVRWILFWYVVPSLVFVIAALAAGRPELSGDQTLVLAVSTAPPALFLGWFTWRHGPSWFGPLTWDQWKAWLPLAALLFGGYLLLVTGAEPAWAAFWGPKLAALGFSEPTPAMSPPGSGLEAAALVLFVGLLVPMVEETLFRGALLRLWTRWWGPAAAVAATGLLFGLIHSQGQVFKVLLGAGAAVLALRSGSLLVPVTTHLLVNLTVVGTVLAWNAGGTASSDPGATDGATAAVELVFTLGGTVLLVLFVRKLVLRDHPEPRRRRRPWAGFSVSHRRPSRFRGLAGRRRFS